MKTSSPSDRPELPGSPSSTPKPYRAPVLTEYGSIAKLTRSGGSTMAEGGMPQMMMCL
jgi:hypothetical protein